MSGKSVFCDPEDEDDPREDPWSEGLGGSGWRESQIAAYREILASGALKGMQARAYELLGQYGPCTASELADELPEGRVPRGLKGNMSARLGELARKGCVDELPERRCRVTGKSVIVYRVNGRQPKTPPARWHSRQCWIDVDASGTIHSASLSPVDGLKEAEIRWRA